jgi:hypothetical protein
MRRGRVAATLVIVAALALAGCSSSRVQVATGSVDTGPWAAWVYRDVGGQGTCLELRPADRPADKLCGLTADNDGIWRPDAPAGGQAFIAGTSGNAAAAVARVTLADGSVAQGAVAGAPAVTDLRFFVVAVPAGAHATQLDLIDDQGNVLSTVSLE